jgi:hypothetical protein
MIAIESLIHEDPLVFKVSAINDAAVQLPSFVRQRNLCVKYFLPMWATYIELSCFGPGRKKRIIFYNSQLARLVKLTL